MTTHCDEPEELTEEEKKERERARVRAAADVFNALQHQRKLVDALNRIVPPRFH